jgi:hypothetical protein
MLMDVIGLIASIMLLCADFAMCSHQGSCPRASYVDGVKPDGVYQCRMPYGCRERQGPRGGWDSRCDGALEYTRRVFCLPDEIAVVDLRGIVRCEPRLRGDVAP